MLSLPVLSGQIYYLQEHRRSTIILDDALIKQTKNIILRCREILSGGVTPAAAFDSKKCTNCSLIDLCLPKQTGYSKDVVSMYIKDQLQKNKGEE
jgi:CRISPR-associated exonuclease Cas4